MKVLFLNPKKAGFWSKLLKLIDAHRDSLLLFLFLGLGAFLNFGFMALSLKQRSLARAFFFLSALAFVALFFLGRRQKPMRSFKSDPNRLRERRHLKLVKDHAQKD